jgi:hypothetical protein
VEGIDVWKLELVIELEQLFAACEIVNMARGIIAEMTIELVQEKLVCAKERRRPIEHTCTESN